LQDIVHDGTTRPNLLLPEATRFAIAIAKNPDTQYGVYWAMEIAAEAWPPVTARENDVMSLTGGPTQPR
jgi:hypothetical protein